jgi:hypothetical protein
MGAPRCAVAALQGGMVRWQWQGLYADEIAQKLHKVIASTARTLRHTVSKDQNQRTRVMGIFEVRGVPLAMRHDGWWLSDDAGRKQNRTSTRDCKWLRVLVLVLLIALADALMWQVAAGASIAVFGIALVSAAVLLIDRQLCRRRLAICSMMALLSVLPIVELVQPLSIALLSVGLALTLSAIAGLRLDQLALGALRLFWVGPYQTVADGFHCISNGSKLSVQKGQIQNAVLGWGLPVVLTAVFTLLFAEANPILDRWLGDLFPTSLPAFNPARWVFWTLIGVLSWPCLILWRLQERLRATREAQGTPRSIAVINPHSILRSLVMFNLLFAVQTGMDVFVLYGVGDLPEGISYAKYAHRGAYPLVVTALLAGVFALVSNPYVKDAPILRILLLIWVVQNVALVCGSLVRLELYVGVYGLTHWRISAFIWMGLVAVGMCVFWLQIWKGLGNDWMMLRMGVLSAVVLYACAFVSFDHMIAHHNLSNDVRLDKRYLCNLGEAALPEIQQLTGQDPIDYCSVFYDPSLTEVSYPQDWREWGFRNWRVRRSLRVLNEAVVIP